MTTIASLRVALEADATKLKKGLSAARDGVKKFAGASIGAAGALAAIVQTGLNSADSIQKLSIRTGVGAEALSALEHQAGLADVKMKDLEKGFTTMSRSIGEAEEGTKAQAEAFEQLGIDTAKFSKLKPEQQFGVIADALNRVGSESQKARLGNDIFGGSFKRLRPLLEGGSKGMRDAAEEAAKLGGILSQEGANSAARANDAVARLQKTFSNLVRTLSVSLAPGIADFFESLGEKIPAVLASVKAAFVGVGTAIGGVAAAIGAFFSGEFKQAAFIIGSISDQTTAAVNASLDASLSGNAVGNAANVNFGDSKTDPALAAIGRTNEGQLSVLRNIERKIGQPNAAVAG